MSSSTPPEARHPGWLPLVTVCLGTFMLLIDVTIVNVALPSMSLDLNASFSDLQWVVDVYALALAALLMLIGSISDIVGRRRAYVTGLGVFVAASLACGVSPSQDALIAARAVQGIGAAAMFATTIALINSAYAGKDRGVAFGVWGATAGAAAAAGPIVGGLLTEGLSWRWIFFVNVPIGLATIVMALRVLGESRLGHRPRVDWAGGAAFTLVAGAATFALIRANDDGWGSAQTLGLLAAAVVALGAFVAIESTVREPLLDLGLLRRPSFVGILIGAVVFSFSAFSALVYSSIWLQSVLGLGAISAGLVSLPLSGLAFVVSGAIGRFLHGWSPRWVIGGGIALIGIGDLLLAGLDGGSHWAALVPGMAVIGLGVGFTSPSLVSTAMAAVPAERGGMAAGAVNTARQLGLAVGIAVLGAVFSSRVGDGLPGPSGLAHAVTSGGASDVLARAPGARRAALDGAIHHAVGTGLGTTFLVAGVTGLVGALAVLGLLGERRAAAKAPVSATAA